MEADEAGECLQWDAGADDEADVAGKGDVDGGLTLPSTCWT